MTVMTGYLYDASGTRVAKGNISVWSCDPTVNGFTTTNDYILGLGGEQVTEMGMGGTTNGTTTSGLAWQHTNAWAGGKLIATYDNDGLHFYFDDPLGTRRAQTDYAGVLEQTCSSLPYGDGETCASTPTEHLFTGKERDTESGNDYFGARYYASSMGRFMSPDPLYLEMHRLRDPQQLNLYMYARNNPLKLIDPNGLDVAFKCDSAANCNQAVKDFNNRKGAQFQVTLGKDGKLHAVDGSVGKNLSKAEGALLGAVNDTKNTATINVIGNTGTSDFGDHVSRGVNGVDMGNLSKLDAASNAGGLNSGDVMAHETMDAYMSLSISDPLAADNAAGALYPGLLGPTNGSNIWNDSRTSLLGQVQDQAIVGGGGTERITSNYVTPIPAIDYKFKGQSAIDDADSRVSGVQYVPPK
jgi:RHS repeat-associated protein